MRNNAKKSFCVIGACTLWNSLPATRCADLGHELHPDFQGQGMMSEALKAALKFGLDALHLNHVEANPYINNLPSRNLLLFLGFTLEGMLWGRHFFYGKFMDQA